MTARSEGYRGGMNDADETGRLAALDIFLPSPPPDVQQQESFLDEAAALAVDGHPITVYLQDEDAWAFEECEPVRALLDSAGESALPGDAAGLGHRGQRPIYPTTEQMQRFAEAGNGGARAPRSAPRGLRAWRAPAEPRCRERRAASPPS